MGGPASRHVGRAKPAWQRWIASSSNGGRQSGRRHHHQGRRLEFAYQCKHSWKLCKESWWLQPHEGLGKQRQGHDSCEDSPQLSARRSHRPAPANTGAWRSGYLRTRSHRSPVRLPCFPGTEQPQRLARDQLPQLDLGLLASGQPAVELFFAGGVESLGPDGHSQRAAAAAAPKDAEPANVQHL